MKRSSGQFERRPQDVYLTPASAIPSLLPFITGKVTEYAEPCAALKTDGPRLIDHLSPHGFRCVHETDVRSGRIRSRSAPCRCPSLPTHLTRDR